MYLTKVVASTLVVISKVKTLNKCAASDELNTHTRPDAITRVMQEYQECVREHALRGMDPRVGRWLVGGWWGGGPEEDRLRLLQKDGLLCARRIQRRIPRHHSDVDDNGQEHEWVEPARVDEPDSEAAKEAVAVYTEEGGVSIRDWHKTAEGGQHTPAQTIRRQSVSPAEHTIQ